MGLVVKVQFFGRPLAFFTSAFYHIVMGITVLPKILVDKIAAGEVIERPASVVKELVENAIDAGAGRIQIELEDGGASLIRVVDDGGGMAPEDIVLAFCSHATSKLSTEDDLFDIRTMGFRGEALSSIASVAQARIVSRNRESEEGSEIKAEGGEAGELRACAAPPGTLVEVRNLFFNVPVRRKFLKTQATEMAHISEAITRLALAHPETAFVLRHNSRDVINLAGAQDRRQRLGEFFGAAIADSIIPMNERFAEVEIEGYLLPPAVDRANTTMQYTFVNRRYIREKTLMHALGEAYRGLMRRHRRPVCFLFLTVDPRNLDVNVHPSKIEVKFRQERQVHNHVLAAMRRCLREAGLTPQADLGETGGGALSGRGENVRNAIADFFSRGGGDAGDDAAARLRPADVRNQTPFGAGHAGPHGPSAGPAGGRGGNVRASQFLDSYIVEECGEGLRITDQHALHERIIYEKLKRDIARSPVQSQKLLVPELVELPGAEFYAVMEMKEQLGMMGMEIDGFGDETVIVRSFPQILGRFDGAEFFRDLLDEFDGPEGMRRVDGRIDRLLIVMACKGAVKAGQPLSWHMMSELLGERDELGSADTCPHGRPTSILLSTHQLEKQFGR